MPIQSKSVWKTLLHILQGKTYFQNTSITPFIQRLVHLTDTNIHNNILYYFFLFFYYFYQKLYIIK